MRLGFRPFYIGGALLAALIVPLWVAMFLGWAPLLPAVPPLLWHAHEMLFGFAAAIIIGFLMTAGKAWTGLATPRGPLLGALALLWLAARVASVSGPYAVYAAMDMALLPLVAAILGMLFWRARNLRNLPMALILLLLGAANVGFHLAVSGVLSLPAVTPLYAGLALIVMIESVISRRVIPMFTMSVKPGLRLVALAQLDWVPVSAGVHALAVGATGGLIIGMMTRTARGHTGRMLAVGKAEVLAYALVMTAAVLRVLLPLLVPALYAASLVVAAAAWSVAFAIYLWIYTPWLMRTRLDGKDG